MANASFVLDGTAGHGRTMARPGVFRRVLEAMMRSRQMQANREITEILARRGGAIEYAPRAGADPAARR